MSSKQLSSILQKLPSATAQPTSISTQYKIYNETKKEETERIVAVVPKSLKTQIKNYLECHKGETERTLLLKGLKSIGFEIKDEWIVDKRTTR